MYRNCRHTVCVCHLTIKYPLIYLVSYLNLRKLTEAEILHSCKVLSTCIHVIVCFRYDLLPKCRMTSERSLILVPQFYVWKIWRNIHCKNSRVLVDFICILRWVASNCLQIAETFMQNPNKIKRFSITQLKNNDFILFYVIIMATHFHHF